ncbi:MAG: hypothetical protein H6Q70_1002 [Firmicutes bacterium]|nr:hypothetical protein [Bacillota bacterium]
MIKPDDGAAGCVSKIRENIDKYIFFYKRSANKGVVIVRLPLFLYN